MRKPEYILLPASPWFIAVSVILAFLFDLLPWGRAFWAPDMLALVLVFWCAHQPRMLGIGVAFVMGVLMDVHDAALLGQTALAYTLLACLALSQQRRILWFPLRIQMVLMVPLFWSVQILTWLAAVVAGGSLPGWSYFLQGPIMALLWPVVTWLLLAPQRRAVDKDETRPI